MTRVWQEQIQGKEKTGSYQFALLDQVSGLCPSPAENLVAGQLPVVAGHITNLSSAWSFQSRTAVFHSISTRCAIAKCPKVTSPRFAGFEDGDGSISMTRVKWRVGMAFNMVIVLLLTALYPGDSVRVHARGRAARQTEPDYSDRCGVSLIPSHSKV